MLAESSEDNKLKDSRSNGNPSKDKVADNFPAARISIYDLDRHQQMTREQEERLEKILHKDQELDQRIVHLGEGMDEIHQKAKTINHEILIHSKEIDKLEVIMDNRLDEITGVTKKTVYVNNKVHY
jgi:uncharacterized coiled-coil DUF342 family protein